MDFFKQLNFASSNEDGATEIAALQDARRILCITGSGTRPLDLLQTKATEIIAFDVNPAQNALLALKMAAIQQLEHGQYLAFLGILPGSRTPLYHQIRPTLTPDVRAYWDRRPRVITRGVWRMGKWEKLLRWNARFLRLFRARALRQLMQAPDIATQAEIWRRHFGDARLRRAIELIGRDWIWRYVIREPGGEFLPPPKEVGARLAADFELAAGRFLFRDSDFATLIFCGTHVPGGALPAHMLPENYARTRARLERIRIVEGHLTQIRAAGVQEVDGFSLSDFGSYTDAAAYADCWQGIMNAATPQAQFCERIFMNELNLPFASLQEDHARSAQLSASDRAIIYRIRAGMITGPQKTTGL